MRFKYDPLKYQVRVSGDGAMYTVSQRGWVKVAEAQTSLPLIELKQPTLLLAEDRIRVHQSRHQQLLFLVETLEKFHITFSQVVVHDEFTVAITLSDGKVAVVTLDELDVQLPRLNYVVQAQDQLVTAHSVREIDVRFKLPVLKATTQFE